MLNLVLLYGKDIELIWFIYRTLEDTTLYEQASL